MMGSADHGCRNVRRLNASTPIVAWCWPGLHSDEILDFFLELYRLLEGDDVCLLVDLTVKKALYVINLINL